MMQYIQAHADLNIGEPLYYAVVKGHEAVVRLLLDQGLDANTIVKGFDGRPEETLLMIACSESATSDSIAHMLLDQGADYNYVNSSQNTALSLAAMACKLSVVERLLSLGVLLDKKTSPSSIPLCSTLNIVINRVLLVAGLNAIGKEGWTPIHNLGRIPDMIELLLRYGANAHARTKDGRTVLHIGLESRKVCDRDMLRIVKLLLNSGLDVNVKSSKGLTPLHAACSNYSANVVGLLLEEGADVNALDNAGMSPFRLASRREVSKATVDVLSILVGHGADVNSQDHRGFTALHHVKFDMWNLNPRYNSQCVFADKTELLLDYGVEIDARDNEGKTALYRFFERGQLAAAEILIKRGADVKVLGGYGEMIINDNTLSLSRLVPKAVEQQLISVAVSCAQKEQEEFNCVL